MIWELARIAVRPGQETAFEVAVAEASGLFRAAEGCISFRLDRSIDHACGYLLVVGWRRIEDHMDLFRNSPAFQQWRALVSPHFEIPPVVEHVETIFPGF